MKKFCVYFHINPLRNEVFYVGKGSLKRSSSSSYRSAFWKSMVAKYGKIVDVIHEDLDEAEAFRLEKMYIAKIGTRAIVEGIKRGPLVNLTAGGEGQTGRRFNHSEETKAKIAASQRRYRSPKQKAFVSFLNSARVGKRLDDKTKARMATASRLVWSCPERRAKMSAKVKEQWAKRKLAHV